ncbi:DUF2145 domain-containing protein [uncultured Pseudoteredinibacter sp.]|uniref:DUF2145 domain-containing protein n=1 Tax=uncultured Pseudoteredinibacter sp. TaxID=1641701 RepID=UPI00262F6C1E|nr:DUF2145 domain-containing protein [uncultured Pseudoteredinibacter sp.]
MAFYRMFLPLLFIVFCSSYTVAGSQADVVAKYEPKRIAQFAKQVEKYAAARGARAFIIARLGRPEGELPKGVRYTHTAVAIYSNIKLANGEEAKGYAIHNLYQVPAQPERSYLLTDYPVDFFWGAQELKAGIVIPREEVQSRLIDLIDSGANKRLHNPKYSLISNPLTQQYQNCTEYTLDLLNAAIYQTTDLDQLKANTRAYFEPQKLRMSSLKISLAAMLRKEIVTKDHKGRPKMATFGSIERYLQKYGLVQHSLTLQENVSVDS